MPESVYVIDRLVAGVHRDPKPKSPLTHAFPTGTKLQVLERKGSMARVRGPAGETGWVEGDYLMTEMPAHLVVEILKDEKREIQEENQLLKTQLANTAAEPGDRAPSPYGPGLDQCAAERDRHAELARKLREAESACATAGPSPNVEPTAPPSDPTERWPAARTALALVKAEIAGVVFLILVLGIALGAYAADYLQRRRHGGFRI
ncbi:MAG: SH3 domain-containing protein [Gammaproteobacteria bacterium]